MFEKIVRYFFGLRPLLGTIIDFFDKNIQYFVAGYRLHKPKQVSQFRIR